MGTVQTKFYITQERIAQVAEVMFLAAIMFLIVRKNDYPWALKRSSDILFLLSAILTALHLTFAVRWSSFLQTHRKVIVGFSLIFSGLILASIVSYVLDGVRIDTEGILMFGRFFEVGVVVLLVGFFATRNPHFFRKVAITQLSTLVYLCALFSQRNPNVTMGRFVLFENRSDNVSYYLIVSLSLMVVLFLERVKPFRKSFFLFYLVAIGFSSILLWTFVRASWVGFSAAAFFTLLMWILKTKAEKAKRVFIGIVLIILLAPLGFLVAPRMVRNGVIGKFFPAIQRQIQEEVGFEKATTLVVAKTVLVDKPSFSFYDPLRVFLWKEYAKKMIERPIGFGIHFTTFTRATSQSTVQWKLISSLGPHNTILEILVLGGFLALYGFLYLFYLGFKNLLQAFKAGSDTRWCLYVLASISGLAVASFFDHMITFRIMWVMVGLGIYAKHIPIVSPSPSITS
ncbi:MAG: hypothetical protein G01um101420_310 [Parcubacteria group bacterium Gr01-1014_20]|nr:MAG: hypothetical protein G01um101420_310 [Parcubacteria group bacterium Gr01-1014_20]